MIELPGEGNTTQKMPKRKGMALWSRSMYRGLKRRREFDQLQSFCMFIGYPRSGHTIVGALLDAHPDVILSTGGKAAYLVERGYRPLQIYSILIDRSQYLAASGVDRGGYFYNVQNQWQGRYRDLKVIGDKYGADGLRIGENDRLWLRLQHLAGGCVRFLHVVRNPYDIISSMRKRRNMSLEQRADLFFIKAEQAARSITRIGAQAVLEVRHESFVTDVRSELNRVCSFLGVQTTADYLDDCAAIVYSSPRQSRFSSPWTPELIASVAERMQAFDFLDGYQH